MPKRIFTKEQIKKLSRNKNISRCSATTVRYTREFKDLAVRQYEEGMSALEIFRNAGIDPGVIGMVSPNHLMHQWRAARKPEASEADPPERLRGELEKLRAEVAYLKEENRFLARLRARRENLRLSPGKNTPSSKGWATTSSSSAGSPESPGAATTGGGKQKTNSRKTGTTASSSRRSSSEERPGGAGGRSR